MPAGTAHREEGRGGIYKRLAAAVDFLPYRAKSFRTFAHRSNRNVDSVRGANMLRCAVWHLRHSITISRLVHPPVVEKSEAFSPLNIGVSVGTKGHPVNGPMC